MGQTCQRCKQPVPISRTGEDSLVAYPDTKWVTENGLHVSFDGGYAEFIDAWNGAIEIVLCHECGHALADFLGLDVHNWHTHVPPELGGTQHADHHDTQKED